jgi:PilZ domain
MSNVLVFERAAPSFAAGLAKRGHHIVYRANASNHCPGCGRSHWYIGRVSAECGFCGTAVPLAETSVVAASPRAANSNRHVSTSADQRRFERTPTKGRKLKLLVDGSPTNFAIHNISEGGVMGDHVGELTPGAKVHVRFEGGVMVPAVVKWTENGLVGLAFIDPILLDNSAEVAN